MFHQKPTSSSPSSSSSRLCPPTQISPDDSAYRSVQPSGYSRSRRNSASVRLALDTLLDLAYSIDNPRTSSSTGISKRVVSFWIDRPYCGNMCRVLARTASPALLQCRLRKATPTRLPFCRFHRFRRLAPLCRQR